MTEHVIAKLLIVAAGLVGLAATSIPSELLPISNDQVEAWARLGVAGGCLVIVMVGMLYVMPRQIKAGQEALNQAHASHERTVALICQGHATSMASLQSSLHEDSDSLGEHLNRLAETVEELRKDNYQDGVLQRTLLQQQVTQLKEIKTDAQEKP